MTSDFGVTAGHVEYSNRRFDFETRHMVMIEVYRHTETLEQFDYELPVYDRNEPYRARLFLTDEEFKTIRRMELNGVLRILHHANVVGGKDGLKPVEKSPSGRTTLRSPVLENAKEPMNRTLFGMVILVRLLHPEKVDSSI